MVFWRKKKQPPAVACYGKLRATGDFVRLNSTAPECAAYDNWLAPSIHHAKESMGAAFAACYQPAAGVFIYRGDDGDGSDEPERGLIGVWAASGDSAGRVYPMTICTCYDYDEMLGVGSALPIAVWPFLAAAYDLVSNGRNMAVQPFLQRVAQLQPIPLTQPQAAVAPYQRWLQTQSMRALWETTFGTIQNRHSVIHHIDATIEIFRGADRPQTSLAMRLPIHAGDTYAAAVWMDVIVRLAKWQRTVLNAFWTPMHDLMVHVGPPQPGTFRELISSGTDAEHVTDLIHAQHPDEATARARLNPQLAAAVDDVGKNIYAFLSAL